MRISNFNPEESSPTPDGGPVSEPASSDGYKVIALIFAGVLAIGWVFAGGFLYRQHRWDLIALFAAGPVVLTAIYVVKLRRVVIFSLAVAAIALLTSLWMLVVCIIDSIHV